MNNNENKKLNEISELDDILSSDQYSAKKQTNNPNKVNNSIVSNNPNNTNNPPYMNSNINKPQTNIEHYSWKKNNKTNNNLIVPKIGNIKIKKENKILLQVYIEPKNLEYFNQFLKTNKIKQTEAMNYILKQYFKIEG